MKVYHTCCSFFFFDIQFHFYFHHHLFVFCFVFCDSILYKFIWFQFFFVHFFFSVFFLFLRFGKEKKKIHGYVDFLFLQSLYFYNDCWASHYQIIKSF
ncbi:hypothetical protein DFH28DRAFT_971075 [Melampsora americana]|nr:hypothetical protein DFH28DRAFT_971075 [Melampsora americana]